MPIPGRVQYLPKEGAYVLAFLDWINQPGNQIYERLCLNNLESHLDTGNYRPASLNSSGIDWGWEMENDTVGPFPSKRSKTDSDPRYSTLDPFRWLDPLYASAKSLEYAKANPATPFRPWSYGFAGASRTPLSIKLAEMIAMVGPKDQILKWENSPYWRMFHAGMNVGAMPKPPNIYYTRLPPPPLKWADSGPNVNLLQRILQEDGRFPGGLDQWFGPRVRGDAPQNPTGGIRSVQRDFTTWGVWDKPIDGIYSVELFEVWDAMLEFDFYTRWS